MIRVNQNSLIEIFKDVSKRLSNEPNKCGNLIYTQKDKGKAIIREPEARHVLATILSERSVNFGLEVPTKKMYKISGKKPDVANTDLVIKPNKEQINVEFKRGQPNTGDIQKDFEKLLREQVSGCAFYHILKNSDKGTLPTLLKKYKNAYNNIKSINDKQPKWFILFILVKEKREWFWKIFDNIAEISDEEFEQSDFSREKHVT